MEIENHRNYYLTIKILFMTHTQLINAFYTAFAEHDVEKMNSYYADDVTFEDPAFGVLQGERAKNMWRMLINNQSGKKFIVTHSNVVESGDTVSAKWEAKYDFSKTGRQVHNKIEATFICKDGKIVDHRDHFNLHSWSSQALGLSGKLIGWTGFFKRKLNNQTNAMLTKYESKMGA